MNWLILSKNAELEHKHSFLLSCGRLAGLNVRMLARPARRRSLGVCFIINRIGSFEVVTRVSTQSGVLAISSNSVFFTNS